MDTGTRGSLQRYIMFIFCWLVWVPNLWKQLCGFFIHRESVDLPYEVIADILSRLPAECVHLVRHSCKPLLALTKSPSFVAMHLSRATPVIAFQHYSVLGLYVDYIDVKNGAQKVNINFTDGADKEIVTRSIDIDIPHPSHNKTCLIYLYGSYNGFLLFRNLMFDSLLHIQNPATQEEVSVVAPDPGYRVRGFFFHPISEEYRVLFISLKNMRFQYFLLGLRSKLTRLISNNSHPAGSARNPIILNDVLHWMVCDSSYKYAHGNDPHCSESIVLFNMNTEEFSTISHPGGECLGRNRLGRKHLAMSLTEKEGHLCLCDSSKNDEIVVWVLDDYEHKLWVKMYVIVEPLKMFREVKYASESIVKVEGVVIYKNELLLSVVHQDLFLYNFQSDSIVRVGKKYKGLSVSAVHHVSTLISLNTDNIIYLSPTEKIL